MSIPPNPYVMGNPVVPFIDETDDQSNHHDNSLRDAANTHNSAYSDESFRGHKFGPPYSTVSSPGVQVPPPNNYSMLHNQNLKDRSEDPANSTDPSYHNQFVNNNQAYPSVSTRVDVWQQTTTQEFWDDRLVYHQRIDRHEVHHRNDDENHGVNGHNTYRMHDTHNGVHDYDSPGYPRHMPTFNRKSDQLDSESNSRSVPPKPTASLLYEQYRSGSGEKPRFQVPPSQGLSDEVHPRAHTTPPHAPPYAPFPPPNSRLPAQRPVPQPVPKLVHNENPVDGVATRRQQQMPEADQPSSSKQDRPKSTSDAQNLASIVADIFRMAEAGEIDQYTTDHLLEQLYATGRDPTPEPVRTPEIVQMQSYHQALYPASGSIEKYRSPSTKTTNTDDSNVDHDNVSGSLMNAGMVSPNFSEGRKSNNPFYALSVAARAPATSAEPSSVLDRSSPPAEKNSRDDDDFALNPSSAASRSAIPNLVTPHPNEQLRSGSVERRGFGAPPPTDDRQPRPRPPSQDSLSHGEPPPPNPYLSGPDSRGNSVDSVAEMLGDLLVEGGAEATKTDTVDSTSPAAKEKERLRKRAVFKRVFKKDKETKSAKA